MNPLYWIVAIVGTFVLSAIGLVLFVAYAIHHAFTREQHDD